MRDMLSKKPFNRNIGEALIVLFFITFILGGITQTQAEMTETGKFSYAALGLRELRGVVGVKTSYTDPSYPTISEYARRARGLGYDFIVTYDEAAAFPDEAKWKEYLAEADKATREGFFVLTGVAVRGYKRVRDGQYPRGISITRRRVGLKGRWKDIGELMSRVQDRSWNATYLYPHPVSFQGLVFVNGYVLEEDNPECTYRDWLEAKGAMTNALGVIAIDRITSLRELERAQYELHLLVPTPQRLGRNINIGDLLVAQRYEHYYTAPKGTSLFFKVELRGAKVLSGRSHGDALQKKEIGGVVNIYLSVRSKSKIESITVHSLDKVLYKIRVRRYAYQAVLHDLADATKIYTVTVETDRGRAYGNSCLVRVGDALEWTDDNAGVGVGVPDVAPIYGSMGSFSLFPPFNRAQRYALYGSRPLDTKTVFDNTDGFAFAGRIDHRINRYGIYCSDNVGVLLWYRGNPVWRTMMKHVVTWDDRRSYCFSEKKVRFLKEIALTKDTFFPVGTIYTQKRTGPYYNYTYIDEKGDIQDGCIFTKPFLLENYNRILSKKGFHEKGMISFYTNQYGSISYQLMKHSISPPIHTGLSLELSVGVWLKHHAIWGAANVGYTLPAGTTIPAGAEFLVKQLYLVSSDVYCNFDFQAKGDRLMPGYVEVSPETIYTSGKYGWYPDGRNLSAGSGYRSSTGHIVVNPQDPNDFTLNADSLIGDYVVIKSPKEFRIDLPNGKYGVKLVLGHYSRKSLDDGNLVHAEGKVALELDKIKVSRHPMSLGFSVEVEDGQLNLVFDNAYKDEGGMFLGSSYLLGAIEVYRVSALDIRDEYGYYTKPKYKLALIKGKKVDDTGYLSLQAEDYCVEGEISKVGLSSGLLIKVSNINPNWSVAVIKDGKYKPICSFQTRPGYEVDPNSVYAYLHSAKGHFWIGNVIKADYRGVNLILLQSGKKTRFVVINPTDQDRDLKVYVYKYRIKYWEPYKVKIAAYNYKEIVD